MFDVRLSLIVDDAVVTQSLSLAVGIFALKLCLSLFYYFFGGQQRMHNSSLPQYDYK